MLGPCQNFLVNVFFKAVFKGKSIHQLTDPLVRLRRFANTLPQPRATTPWAFAFGGGLLALVAWIAPPRALNLTSAAFVFLTKVLPFAPSRFFLRAVAALSDLERLLALDLGRHLSGFFLSFEVPHLPLILPSVPILTQSWSRHFLSSPTFLPLCALSVIRVFAVFRCGHVGIRRRIRVKGTLGPSFARRTNLTSLTFL
jgi:hypothetical protein